MSRNPESGESKPSQTPKLDHYWPDIFTMPIDHERMWELERRSGLEKALREKLPDVAILIQEVKESLPEQSAEHRKQDEELERFKSHLDVEMSLQVPSTPEKLVEIVKQLGDLTDDQRRFLHHLVGEIIVQWVGDDETKLEEIASDGKYLAFEAAVRQASLAKQRPWDEKMDHQFALFAYLQSEIEERLFGFRYPTFYIQLLS